LSSLYFSSIGVKSAYKFGKDYLKGLKMQNYEEEEER